MEARVLRRMGGLVAAVAAIMALGPGSASAGWKPEPATYSVGQRQNVPVTMADGTVLRVDVYFPVDPKTGREASGKLPVILTQTPYGKDSSESSGGSAAVAGDVSYLPKRGYIEVVADVRGTGASQGTWGLFDPIQGSDGAHLVRWSARLRHSSGKVGTVGPSYLGINQLLTAAHLGPHSPLKAMFPIIAGDDIYRDTAFDGGMVDAEFGLIYYGLTGSLNLIQPLLES